VLKIHTDDYLKRLSFLDFFLSRVRVNRYRPTLYLYRRSDRNKFGELFSDKPLPTGRYTSDSHVSRDGMRVFGETPDYYFSLLVIFQRNLISRKKLMGEKISPSKLQELLRSGYWIRRVHKHCSSSPWSEIVSAENAKILRPNLVVDSVHLYVGEGDLKPTNWKADSYQVSPNENIVRIENADSKEITKLDEAVYLGSRKDKFFYHAMHWTLFKFLRLDSNLNGTPILINHDLNPTIKEFISRRIELDFPDSTLIEFNPMTQYEVKRLHTVLLGSSDVVNSQREEIQIRLQKIVLQLGQVDNDLLNAPKSGLVIICKRNRNLILERPTLANWEEVVEKLSAYYQVEAMDMSMMTLEEQALYFSTASIVISEHGGSLSNIVFLKKGAYVLELNLSLSDNIYKEIAKSCQLKYRSVNVTCVDDRYSANVEEILEILRS